MHCSAVARFEITRSEIGRIARQSILALLACTAEWAYAAKDADCSVARDPRRCAALQTARDACSGLQGQAHSTCIHEALPPPDCTRAPNTLQCQAREAAAQACKDKYGKARRQCLRNSGGSR